METSSDQYEALRNGCGFVALSGWSSITLTGADRQSFLNSFCTNDVKRLAPGESCEAFITSVKGKVLGHGLIDCRDAELVFITVPNQAQALVAHFDRYIIREDVQLRDTTAERSYLVASGAKTLDVLARLEPTMSSFDSFDRRPQSFAATLAGTAVRIVAWHWLGKLGRGGPPLACLLECSPGDVAPLRTALLAEGALECSLEAFTVVRIEAGLPLFGVDFDAENFPQEVARDDRAINFNKGCYLGQETVARIDALGHVNRQLVGVRFDGREVPAAGTELRFGENVVGRVTSAAISPQLDAPLALAMVRREWSAPGAKLESTAGPLEVVKLPLAV